MRSEILVGYETESEKNTADSYHLTFITKGALLRQLMRNDATNIFGDISHLIIDEAHNRDRFSDILLGTLEGKTHTIELINQLFSQFIPFIVYS